VTRACGLAAIVGLLVAPSGVWAQPTATDPEVLKGIAEVEEGEYDAAIFTLDTAARQLAGDPKRANDLSQAYLYLGIAYFGKGHEAAAKAKFREAIVHFRDLSLSAEQFPPQVIDLFEAAREEAGDTPAEEKKGGSKKPLILIGVGGAAVAGVAVVTSGGGEDSTEPAAQTRSFSDTLAAPDHLCSINELYVQAAGLLEATITWTNPAEHLNVYLWDGQPWAGDPAATENRTSETSAELQHTVSPRNYLLDVCLGWSDCRQARQDTGLGDCATDFQMTVHHP